MSFKPVLKNACILFSESFFCWIIRLSFSALIIILWWNIRKWQFKKYLHSTLYRKKWPTLCFSKKKLLKNHWLYYLKIYYSHSVQETICLSTHRKDRRFAFIINACPLLTPHQYFSVTSEVNHALLHYCKVNLLEKRILMLAKIRGGVPFI